MQKLFLDGDFKPETTIDLNLLSALENLKTLELVRVEEVTGKLHQLFPKLEQLAIATAKAPNMDEICNCQDLKTLRLWNSHHDEVSFFNIYKLAKLESLKYQGVGNGSYIDVASLENLTHLDISDGNEGTFFLGPCEKLRSLRLSGYDGYDIEDIQGL